MTHRLQQTATIGTPTDSSAPRLRTIVLDLAAVL